MKRYRIKKEIRNEFFFQIIYGLFYPAVLGTILVYVMQDALSSSLFKSGIFPVISLFCLVWYFVLDFYVGFTNFKGDDKNYDLRYTFCDIVVIIAAFIAYYGLWLSHLEFLFFIAVSIISWTLILLDYYDTVDVNEKFEFSSSYDLMLLIFGIVSFGMSIVSLTIPQSLFYIISKNLFIVLTSAGILYYTFYILSEESYELE